MPAYKRIEFDWILQSKSVGYLCTKIFQERFYV